MKVYLGAAMGDEAVAAAVAEYAREGHTEARARVLADLEDELGHRRSALLAEQESDLAEQRAVAMTALNEEIGNLRLGKLTELENALTLVQQRHAEKIAQLDGEHQRRQAELEQKLQATGIELAQIEASILDAWSMLETARAGVEAEKARARDAAAEVDRLLSVSKRLSTVPSSATPATASAIPFIFPDREAVSIRVLAQSIDGLAMLSAKGRDLLRRLIC